MNYDEIPAGPELDALVAEKVFGCIIIEGGDRPMCGCLGMPREARIGKKPYPHGHFDEHGCSFAGTPEYSTDIAAAWTVVDEVQKRNPGFSVWKDEYCWLSCFGIGFSVSIQGQGDTAPLAICRAVLKTVLALG